MYITSEQHTRLAQGLFDKIIELRKAGEKKVKIYELELQEVIEEVFPNKCWHDVTKCDIGAHLAEHKSAKQTVIAILKGLKED
jgi:hypothetical protein